MSDDQQRKTPRPERPYGGASVDERAAMMRGDLTDDELAVRNAIPLTNPAGVKRQLTGTFARRWVRPMAEVLGALGSDRAWIVHGGDGSDEIAISDRSFVAELKDGKVTEFEIHPEDAGLPVHPFEDIVGGTPAENVGAMRAVLDGAKGAYRDAVLLNSAAALLIAAKVSDLKEGVALAAQSIDSGAAKAKVMALVAAVPLPPVA